MMDLDREALAAALASELKTDRENISEMFAQRVTLAKQTLKHAKELAAAEAAKEAEKEWRKVKKWVSSDADTPGSFLWCCDLFELEPDAARRAIREKK